MVGWVEENHCADLLVIAGCDGWDCDDRGYESCDDGGCDDVFP